MNRTCTGNVTFLHCAVIAAAVGGCQDRSSAAEPDPALQSLVDGASLNAAVQGPRMAASERTRLTDHVRRFYKGQNYQLVWTDDARPSDRYRQLTETLGRAGDHGLPVSWYTIAAGAGAAGDEPMSAGAAARFDVEATATFFRYALHLTSGRLDPRALQRLWTLEPKRPDLVAALTSAVQSDDLAAAMQHLQPAHAGYRELQQALVRYRTIAAKGGWPSLPPAARLKPGHRSELMPALRQRLAMEGDLDAAHEKNPDLVFDEPVVEAVKRFEERHRLRPDGILDAETVKALNVPVEHRIRAIELNLERWRWLPDAMPSRYLLVNVPDFRLEAVEQGRPVMNMRVVVGAPDNKTPIFADEMTHVVFSPYWNVPPGIAGEETIPRAASDPAFLARNNMEVVGANGDVLDPSSVDWSNTQGLRIRQRPGSGNALGGVKFMFPNTFDVYLHDTNATALFDRLDRGMSHGCVRVEEPHKLAQYVLRDQPDWTADRIAAAMTSGQETHVKLETRIPVYIVYKTAWVHDGGVRFLKDLYGHDASQAARLWPDGDAAETPPSAGKLQTRR